MTFTPLASSSAGNAYLVEDGSGARLLLECGVSHRKLRKYLAAHDAGAGCGIPPYVGRDDPSRPIPETLRRAEARAGCGHPALQGCLITHEHKDHSRCWAELVKDGVPVWASAGTREKLDGGLIQVLPQKEEGPEGEYLPFRLGPFDVLPFPTFHDAEQPVGYLIRSRTDGEKLAFATDTVNLRCRFPGVNLLAIEANYDRDILARCERMPEKVKQRVTNSHMEIGTLCGYLKGLDLSACRAVYLLHLSDASANEGDFVRRVRAVVPRGTRVEACPKESGE